MLSAFLPGVFVLLSPLMSIVRCCPNSIIAPGIVDADRQPILEHSEIYSGIYGRASITFYAFNTKTSRGIACGLQNVQKLRDGEPLGGHSSAEEDFADDDDFLD